MEIIQVCGPYYFTNAESGTKYSLVDMKKTFYSSGQHTQKFKLHMADTVYELHNGWTVNNRGLFRYQIEEIVMIEALNKFSVENIMYAGCVVTDPVLVKKSVCFSLPSQTESTIFVTLQELYYDNIMSVHKNAQIKYNSNPIIRYVVDKNCPSNSNDCYNYILFITDNKHYCIEKNKFHINGKYIAEYTLDEISELSPPYVISTTSSIEHVENIQQWYINYATDEIQIVDFRTDYPYTPTILKILIDMKQIKTIVLFRHKSAKIYDEILDQGIEVVIRNK